MTKHYFAQDGNFGDADRLLVLDTSDWTEDDWETIEESGDTYRLGVAARIAKGKKNNA